jgi:hypothetical protein
MPPKSSKSASGKVSKTARSSTPTVKGAGEYAYVLTPAGRTVKMRVGSSDFLDAVREFAPTNAVRPTLAVLRRSAAEFTNPGWELAVDLIQGIEPVVEPAEESAEGSAAESADEATAPA